MANPTKIPLVDLVAQYHTIRAEIDAAIREVLERGAFILGPNVMALEEEIARYLGVRAAVAVGNGTDALLLTLRGYGIGPGDEVVVPTWTFFATAEAVSQVGATPVFVDMEPQSYCLDTERLEQAITRNTKAIIPVHMFGHPADMAPVLAVAERRCLKVIEDNAQALGADYKGQKTGALGDAACLSFFPSKNLGAYGDGGMIVTNDLTLADTLRKLRTHGWSAKYYPELLGFNSRLDELQAAILRVKLRYRDRWNERRRELAARYCALLTVRGLQLPSEALHARHIYHLFVVRTPQRDRLQEHLKAKGIGCGVYYPLALHQLAPYRQTGAAGPHLPHAEQAARETLALPLYPELDDSQLQAVVTAVRQALSA